MEADVFAFPPDSVEGAPLDKLTTLNVQPIPGSMHSAVGKASKYTYSLQIPNPTSFVVTIVDPDTPDSLKIVSGTKLGVQQVSLIQRFLVCQSLLCVYGHGCTCAQMPLMMMGMVMFMQRKGQAPRAAGAGAGAGAGAEAGADAGAGTHEATAEAQGEREGEGEGDHREHHD